jgi:phosphoserine phosphatase RsbU/P
MILLPDAGMIASAAARAMGLVIVTGVIAARQRKGLDAAGRCAAVLAVFRERAFAEPDVVKLAEEMDARIPADMGIDDFVTAFIAGFAPDEVRIVNCGHHPPVKAADRAELQLVASGQPVPPLGLHPRPCD